MKAEKPRQFIHEQEKEQLISLCGLCDELTPIEKQAQRWKRLILLMKQKEVDIRIGDIVLSENDLYELTE